MKITEETIDSFLRGDLNGTELAAFNKAVATDPKLQHEVSFQKDITDSIKLNRHQQLKNRLNSIDVKPVGVGFYSSPYVKLAASIGVVALLVGGYAILNNNNNKDSDNTRDSITTSTIESTTSAPISTNITADNNIIESTTANEVIASESKHASAETKKADKKVIAPSEKATTPTNKKQPAKNTYEDLSEQTMDVDNTVEGVNDNFDMPTMNHGGNTSSISSPQIKVSIVKESDLGYRFFNNQLFLHGNFSNSTYELFELNNKPTKQLFLYFENNYYELIQGKTKVTGLRPITDKAILLQLTQLREH